MQEISKNCPMGSTQEKCSSRHIVAQRVCCCYFTKLEKEEKQKQKFDEKAFCDNLWDIESIVPNALHLVKKDLLTLYGLIANSDLSLWKIIETTLGNTPLFEYFNHPSNMTYHDLCTFYKLPEGNGATLGLRLKFCVNCDRPPGFPEKSISYVPMRILWSWMQIKTWVQLSLKGKPTSNIS